MAPWKQILVGDEVVRHGSEIVALTAYQAPPPPLSFGADSVHEAQSAGEAASKSAKHLLLETIRDVLAVGTRGRGGFAGLLLGPVSQNVAAYAECTVVVAR